MTRINLVPPQELTDQHLFAEFRAMHSARHKGKIVSEETRKKQAAAKLGRKQSPETIAKRAATLKAIWEKKNGNKHTN